MKRIFISLALTLGLVQTNAQEISFGIKAEANMSNFIVPNTSNVAINTLSLTASRKSNIGFGASLGGFMKYDISRNFAIQPELLFHLKNSSFEASYKITSPSSSGAAYYWHYFHYWGAEIPIYALGQWRVGNGRLYAGVGPYVALGFSAVTDFPINFYEVDALTEADRPILHRFDFGFGAMIGYEFRNRIQVNVGYKIGLFNVRDYIHHDGNPWHITNHLSDSWRWQTLSLGLGYRF